ncbi:MAG: 4Fe-4S binding protein [Candidatus Magnetobacterium sp. LHC-1]|uniref:4Fe-4S binding protein n=1 Tax=Candidatus Magnetobacterium casense TaxID=1455061 RepID=UPI0005912483|nr:4Fe-4S binding protein [Candidatus Magnetobacterium casensis]MBF0337039.1 4Fe-4S binding protein [Nitrospirota bacterium]MBF0608008.1 4Fe-4S binding protein [Nitrospirota bacterium]
MRGRVEISPELCKGCEFCIVACPQGIIALSERFNSMGYFPAVVTDMDRCTGCTLCAQMCPELAIEVWRQEG